MANTPPKTFTANDLILRFLEMRGLTPDFDQWNEIRLEYNPPRLYRLRQLQALFHAFAIPWDPAGFVEGKFIDPEDVRYDPVLERAAQFDPKRHHLPHCFRILMRYRETVEEVLSFSSGVFESFGLFTFAYFEVPRQMKRTIQENVSTFDDALTAFISPEAKTFTIGELVAYHGYPDVNLPDIDIEYY
jgi:hypothetical protein